MAETTNRGGRPKLSETHFPCGHERTEENTYVRKGRYGQCRTCKNASRARYYQENAGYFHRYRITHADYFAAYRKACWSGDERPKVSDFGTSDGSDLARIWAPPIIAKDRTEAQ